jgi:hypothetical protein
VVGEHLPMLMAQNMLAIGKITRDMEAEGSIKVMEKLRVKVCLSMISTWEKINLTLFYKKSLSE